MGLYKQSIYEQCVTIIITCKLFWNHETEHINECMEKWEKQKKQYHHVTTRYVRVCALLIGITHIVYSSGQMNEIETNGTGKHVAGHSMSLSENINTITAPLP